MKTEYPYYVAVKINAGQLVKVYRDKKFKSYDDCYKYFMWWASTYHKIFSNGQYAIVEYTSSYECRIITIFTNTVETKIYMKIKDDSLKFETPTTSTYNEWITFEEGCELPNDWEGVIVAAPQHRSKIMHCIYINGQFHTLGIKDQIVIPKKFMRIDISNITMKDAYTYIKNVSNE